MPTECSPALFEFAPVESRAVVAGFDGGAITSNAGALLLGITDRGIGLVRRFAVCFRDARAPERVEHEVITLVGQRVFGSALGHEDLVDHDRLRHDPVLANLAGKLKARRAGCAPLAGRAPCPEPTSRRCRPGAISNWAAKLMVACRPLMWNSSTGARSAGARRSRSFPELASASRIARSSIPCV